MQRAIIASYSDIKRDISSLLHKTKDTVAERCVNTLHLLYNVLVIDVHMCALHKHIANILRCSYTACSYIAMQ